MVVLQALRPVLPPDIAEIREGDLSQLAGCGSGVVGKRRGHARRIVGDAGKEVGLTVVAALRKRGQRLEPVPRVGGDGFCRVGDKAAIDDMGSERDVRPLCPRPAFWCHELVAMGLVALGTKLRSMTWVVNETSGRYVPGRLFGATSWWRWALSRWEQSCAR